MVMVRSSAPLSPRSTDTRVPPSTDTRAPLRPFCSDRDREGAEAGASAARRALGRAERCFEDGLEAFGHYEDAPNAALLITNLAAARRRRAYLDFVASGHLTLGQRQIYVQVIALYEQALAQLAAERRQRRRRGRCAASASGGGVTPGVALAPVARGGLAIRTIVQLELAGTYTAFAQQLQQGGRAAAAEAAEAVVGAPGGSDRAELAAGGDDDQGGGAAEGET
jgi:hypothetical protein